MELIAFSVAPDAGDADAEELDQLTRELLRDLRDQPVESAELVRSGTAPAGAKGLDAATAEIAVMVGTAALKMLIDFLMTKKARIRFEGRLGGTPVKFEGATKDFARLLATLTTTPATKGR